MANPLKRFAGDPTHPAITHFPLALYPAAVLFDVLALTRSNGSLYTHGAFILILAASVMTVIAMVTGFAELFDLPPGARVWKLALAHMSVQLTAGGVFLVSLLLRVGHIDDAQPPFAAFALGIVGTLLLFVGGWLGGHMVFTHGVGVKADCPRD